MNWKPQRPSQTMASLPGLRSRPRDRGAVHSAPRACRRAQPAGGAPGLHRLHLRLQLPDGIGQRLNGGGIRWCSGAGIRRGDCCACSASALASITTATAPEALSPHSHGLFCSWLSLLNQTSEGFLTLRLAPENLAVARAIIGGCDSAAPFAALLSSALAPLPPATRAKTASASTAAGFAAESRAALEYSA